MGLSMNRAHRISWLLGVAVCGIGSAGADRIELHDGRILEGKVVQEGKIIVFRTWRKSWRLRKEDVHKLTFGYTAADKIIEKAKELDRKDAAGFWELAQKARAIGMFPLARQLFSRARSADPRDPRSRAMAMAAGLASLVFAAAYQDQARQELRRRMKVEGETLRHAVFHAYLERAEALAEKLRDQEAFRIRIARRLELEAVRRRALSIIRNPGLYSPRNAARSQKPVAALVDRARGLVVRPPLKKWLEEDRRVGREAKLLAAVLEGLSRAGMQVAPIEERWKEIMGEFRRIVWFDGENRRRHAGILEENKKKEGGPTEEGYLVRLINEYRMVMGLVPLEIDRRLMKAAAEHSLSMRRTRVFSHFSNQPGCRTPASRAARQNFTSLQIAENIALVSQGARAVFEGWYTSPGHHRNLLLPGVDVIGAGRSRGYWTALFGKERK